MSAYGHIPTPIANTSTLLPRSYALPLPNALECSSITLFPTTRETSPADLTIYMTKVFNEVVVEGRTYPQREQHSISEFEDYFLSGTLFIALLDPTFISPPLSKPDPLLPLSAHDFSADGIDRPDLIEKGIESLRGEGWEKSFVGMFYVKPNYPSRSSHNCNGGFVVSTHHRGLSIGKTLGRAYLNFAPRLGYKASVFNLVYTSNLASLKIWDSLGFTRAGLIPDAGLLKSAIPGGDEEYCDAVVFHKTF